MSNSKLQTFNIKKCQKREAKKRKLEAFLNLVRNSDETSGNKKKAASTFADSYKALKDELKKYHKTKEADPLFYPADDGKKALVQFLLKDELSSKSPLFIEDIYHLLLKSILGNISPFPLRWAKLEHANQVHRTVLIQIERLCEENVTEMKSSFNQNFLLPYVFEVASTDQAFAAELSSYHLRSDFCKNLVKKSYSCMFPIDQTSVAESEINNKQNKVSKLHLLLSPIQLAMEHYPLPQSIFDQSKSDGYCFSKETYTPVHADSPMFAVDCEMCRTITGKQEVTRIAIVNENLETVYHTLVKPEDDIVDYVTRFSGITEKMLRDVKIRLSDVQRDIQNLLPSDAILCGQSLNCDLHGLKMIHPYVIDTSVIYNEKGIRQMKTSLRQLALIHLKESIQDGKKGHNPVEDSIATMKLVQLKLKNSLGYGDAVLSPDDEECDTHISDNEKDEDPHSNLSCKNGYGDAVLSPGDEECDTQISDKGKHEDPHSNLSCKNGYGDAVLSPGDEECDTQISDKGKHEDTHSNLSCKDCGFFPAISRFTKKVCLIGDENSLSNYNPAVITDKVTKVNASGLKNVMKATVENLEGSDFVISHLVFDKENNAVKELNDEIKEIYDSFPNKTLFIIFMSNAKKLPVRYFRHNFCMVTLKKNN